MHGLEDFFGLTNAGGLPYLFWSGIGSDLSELAILGGLVAVYRRHVCHVRGCWRMQRHPLDGTPYTLCGRHHPDVPDQGPSIEHIEQARTPSAPNADP